MPTPTLSMGTVRHRLLEGVLLRLARRPQAGELVLRGGMLLRHWFRPVIRRAEDLDLVSATSFPSERARELFPVLLAEAVEDGVSYDLNRLRADDICLETGNPGVRVFLTGQVGGVELDFHVDVTMATVVHPAAVLGDLPTARAGPAQIWMSRPEMILGQKVQALCHLGMLHWRPKDLDDLRLLLARVPMDPATGRAAIRAHLAVLGRGDEERDLFGAGSWWQMKLSSARWLDYARSARGRSAPRELRDVVDEVSRRIQVVLEEAS